MRCSDREGDLYKTAQQRGGVFILDKCFKILGVIALDKT